MRRADFKKDRRPEAAVVEVPGNGQAPCMVG